MKSEVAEYIIKKFDREIEERDLEVLFSSNPEYHSFPLSKERLERIEERARWKSW